MGRLDDALLAAARLKNSPLTIGSVTADPSSNTLSTSGIDITKHINKADTNCKEFGVAGVAAMNEVCTGLLGTFDTMHSGVSVVFLGSAVLLGMMLAAFWHGDGRKKNETAGAV